MAIVDDQGGPAIIGDTSAEIDCRGVSTPFEDRADTRRLQSRWQQSLEKRNWIGRDGECEFTIRINLDPTLMPTTFGPDRLVNGQRVEKFISKDDGGTFRHVRECGVPKDRNALTFEDFFLLRLQQRADFDQVCYDRSPEFRHDFHCA